MPPSDDIDAKRTAVLQSMSSSIPSSVVDSTVIIVRANKPVVRQLGTGTLFRVAERSFVVTAAHVLRQAQQMDATLGISGSDGHFIATAGQWILSGGDLPNKEDDPFDLALYSLSDDQVRRLHRQRFLRLEDVSFLQDLSRRFFVIFGFPHIWSTACDEQTESMSLKALQFATFDYEGDASGLAGFNSKHHLLLDAKDEYLYDDRGDEIRFRTNFGTRARMPNDLRGVSGCSVWSIGDLRTSIHSWRQSDAKLVGIVTGVYEARGLIKATRWVAASTLLYYAFPDLRRPIELHGTT